MWVDSPISGAGPEDLARDRPRQVVLAQVQHVGSDRVGDVGAVVDREQRTVPVTRLAEDRQVGDLVAWPQAPSAAAGRCQPRAPSPVEEPARSALPLARVSAQVEAGTRSAAAQVEGMAQPSWPIGGGMTQPAGTRAHTA